MSACEGEEERKNTQFEENNSERASVSMCPHGGEERRRNNAQDNDASGCYFSLSLPLTIESVDSLGKNENDKQVWFVYHRIRDKTLTARGDTVSGYLTHTGDYYTRSGRRNRDKVRQAPGDMHAVTRVTGALCVWRRKMYTSSHVNLWIKYSLCYTSQAREASDFSNSTRVCAVCVCVCRVYVYEKFTR